VISLQEWRRRRGICPRCGVAFADTTEDVLRRCYELAQAGAR
jgi:ribosomal protein S27AE